MRLLCCTYRFLSLRIVLYRARQSWADRLITRYFTALVAERARQDEATTTAAASAASAAAAAAAAVAAAGTASRPSQGGGSHGEGAGDSRLSAAATATSRL